MPDISCFDFDPLIVFVCIDPDDPNGGCGAACSICPDSVASMIASKEARLNGQRWVRPTELPGYPSRNAWGYVYPLKSGHPQLVPYLGFYDVAPCFKNLGMECFDEQNCDCFPIPSLVPGTPPACAGVSNGQPALGRFPGCHFFTGYDWPGEASCRLKTADGPALVSPQPSTPLGSELQQIGMVQLSPGHCYNNLGILCWAAKASAGGCSSAIGGLAYYSSPNEQLWNYVDVDWNDASFVDSPGYFLRRELDHADLEMRQSVMDWIASDAALGAAGVTRFNRLDKIWSNLNMDGWQRDFPASGTTVECNDLPVVYQYPKSVMHLSGHQVHADLLLRSASVKLSMVFERWRTSWQSSYDTFVRPFIRFKLTCEFALRCRYRIDGDHFIILSAPDGTAYRTDLGPFLGDAACNFKVVANNRDTVVLKDAAGRRCHLPGSLTWEGGLGFFTETPGNEDLDIWATATDPAATSLAQCCYLAQKINAGGGLTVRGIPTELRLTEEEFVSKQHLYYGGVRLTIPNHGVYCV